jgi:hypothetical protein
MSEITQILEELKKINLKQEKIERELAELKQSITPFKVIPREAYKPAEQPIVHKEKDKKKYPQRIVLTTYPQAKTRKITWGANTPELRGPIIASRHPQSLPLRNAIGSHAGSYSIYRALAVAMGELSPHHRPDLHNTEPVVNWGPFDSWYDPMKIVSIDPWGHSVQEVFRKELDQGIDLRPTIAITKAHMQLAEIEKMVLDGDLKIDGD